MNEHVNRIHAFFFGMTAGIIKFTQVGPKLPSHSHFKSSKLDYNLKTNKICNTKESLTVSLKYLKIKAF
jgi:hypothetical protein